jgi:TRAP-type C4-dicarboxylate transport system substrate-binding protein
MRTLWDKMEAESRAVVLAAGIKANDVDVPAFRKAAAPIHERFLGDSSLRDLFDSIRGLA